MLVLTMLNILDVLATKSTQEPLIKRQKDEKIIDLMRIKRRTNPKTEIDGVSQTTEEPKNKTDVTSDKKVNNKSKNSSDSDAKKNKGSSKKDEKKDPKLSSPDSTVKMIIFDDSNVVITFGESVIVDDVLLLKRTNESDSHVVKNLKTSMENSREYIKKIQTLNMSINNTDSKTYDKAYKNALVSQIKINLDINDFEEDDVYLFKIKTWNNDEEMYTEEFVFNGDEFEHLLLAENEGKWYKSIWFWIAMAVLVLCLSLVFKMCCF